MTGNATGSNDILVELRSVAIQRGGTKILRDVTITVKAGEIYGLIGPNGAGKTTTLAVVVGLLAPAAGSARVLGLDPVRQAEAVRARTGVMPERGGFYDWMTASAYLCFFGRLHGREHTLDAVGDRLAQVGLPGRGDQPIATFSHGMRQRLGLARALIADPDLLVLDEPTSGLDPRGRREIHELLMALSRDRGTGILISTHLLDDVERLCTRIGIIAGGITVAEGSIQELSGKGKDLATEQDGLDRYRLRLGNPRAAALSFALLRGVSLLSRDGEWCTLGIPSDEAPEMVWRELMFLGWPVREIQRVEKAGIGSGLERLYLDLTKGEERKMAA